LSRSAKNDDVKAKPAARTGQALVDVLRDSPLRDVAIEHAGVRSPVREVILGLDYGSDCDVGEKRSRAKVEVCG
jgi:hypothetical protein